MNDKAGHNADRAFMPRLRLHLSVAAIAIILAAACGLRFSSLASRPMHHDEANQAFRCGILMDTGEYRYDPEEHHGPLLYYATLPVIWLSGAEQFSLTTETVYRAVPAVFGLLLVLASPLLSGVISMQAAIWAALFTAVSPALVFYSRFYIQESLLVFFTFLSFVTGWRCLTRRSYLWPVTCGLSLGAMYATKETCILAYASMFAAILFVLLTARGRRTAITFLMERSTVYRLVLAVLTAIAIAALFYSSFMTNPAGPIDSVRSFASYFHKGTGGDTEHVHPWFFYLRLLTWSRTGPGPWWSEAFLLLLALLGLVAAFLPSCEKLSKDPHFTRCIAIYAVTITLLYTFIPYKTTWCMLSFLHALIILAALGACFLVKIARRIPFQAIVAALILAGAAHLSRQAWAASVDRRFFCDTRNPYVYAHTSIDFLRLVKRVDELSAVHPDGRNMLIAVVTPPDKYWPLPWYLRQYGQVGYWPSISSLPANEPAIIIVDPDQSESSPVLTRENFTFEYYGLRPEVPLCMYIRRDLWEAFLKTRM